MSRPGSDANCRIECRESEGGLNDALEKFNLLNFLHDSYGKTMMLGIEEYAAETKYACQNRLELVQQFSNLDLRAQRIISTGKVYWKN